MIRFSCPQCHTVFTAPLHRVGRKATCGKCKHSLIVPEPPVAAIAPSKTPSLRKKSWVIRILACLLLAGSSFFLGRLTAPPEYDTRELSHSITGEKGQQADRNKGNKNQGRQRQLWEPDELSRKLSGRTFAEVRSLLGDPDQIAEPSALDGPEERSEDLWIYKGILRGHPSSETWMIRFRFGRVYLSCIPINFQGPLHDGGGATPNLRWP